MRLSVEFRDSAVHFNGKVSHFSVQAFAKFSQRARQQRRKDLILDFANVSHAYPNSMVPIIAIAQRLLASGHFITCVLPRDEQVRRLFRNTNWAHFLSPTEFDPSGTDFDRHLAVQHFNDGRSQQKVVSSFLDVTMRALELDRSVLQGLEWSLNEITDNVLNHSDSSIGGFVQLTTFRETKTLDFCVADCGRGILASLRESRSTLQFDKDAIAEAVKAGVTRNKDIGQGNGLSGTLRIALAAEGMLTITSGQSAMTWIPTDTRTLNFERQKRYEGTVVDVQFRYDHRLDLASVLSFGMNAPPYTPTDTVELKYLSDDSSRLLLKVSEETEGFGSRRAGMHVRTKCKNLLNAEPGCLLVIDWDGVQMVSSSFADEFVGKLFAELGPMQFMNRVRQQNAMPVVSALLDRAIMQRMGQQVAGEQIL